MYLTFGCRTLQASFVQTAGGQRLQGTLSVRRDAFRLDLGNQALARDLIDAIDHDREPLYSLGQVRSINEMVQGVYASHLSGGRRVELPLAYRSHPLAD